MKVLPLNRTARSRGAVGPNAICPRLIMEHISVWKHHRILDFGAGPEAPHTRRLQEVGYNVTAWDIGNNFVQGVHDPMALERRYDVVMLSNVLNVQVGALEILHILHCVRNCLTVSGILVVNYPLTPRYSRVTTLEILGYLHLLGSLQTMHPTAWFVYRN